jgi:TRAP transporter TAXI family solute receptor
MKRGRIMKVYLGVLVCLLLIVTTVCPTTAELRIKIGSTGSQSSHYAFGQAFADVINKYVKGLSATHVETGASYDNNRRLKSGDLDMATITSWGSNFESYNGLDPFKEAHKELRILGGYCFVTILWTVRADLPIYKLEDLNGQKFSLGMSGSESAKQLSRIFDVLGIKVIPYPGTTNEAVAAIKEKRIAGYAKATVSVHHLDASQLDLKTYMDIRVLGATKAQMEKSMKVWPMTPWTYVKTGQIVEMPEAEGWFSGGAVNVATTTRIPQETIYQVMKACFGEHRDYLGAAFKGFTEVTDEMWLKFWIDAGKGNAPLHAGAVQYYKEKGLDVPDRLIPPEYKGN